MNETREQTEALKALASLGFVVADPLERSPDPRRPLVEAVVHIGHGQTRKFTVYLDGSAVEYVGGTTRYFHTLAALEEMCS